MENSELEKIIEKNWTIYLAFNNLLSNRMLFITLDKAVKFCTENEYSFSDIFEVSLQKEGFPITGFIRPKIEFGENKIITILQNLIQKIFFIGEDYYLYPDSSIDERDLKFKKLNFISDLLIIGNSSSLNLEELNIDLDTFNYILNSIENNFFIKENKLKLDYLVKKFTIMSQLIKRDGVFSEEIEDISFVTCLSLCIKKLSDSLILNDEYEEAYKGYEISYNLLCRINKKYIDIEIENWKNIINLSMISCIKEIKSPVEAQKEFSEKYYKAKIDRDSLFISNGRLEYYDLDEYSKKYKYIPQYNYIEEKLLSESNHLELYSWVNRNEKYTEKYILSIIKQQLAIGSLNNAKIYMGLLSEVSFEFFHKKGYSEKQLKKEFMRLVTLLIESERIKSVLNIKWDSLYKEVNTFIKPEIIQQLLFLSRKHIGSRANRLKVLIELFRKWFPLVNKSNNTLLVKIWNTTIDIGLGNDYKQELYNRDTTFIENSLNGLLEYSNLISNNKEYEYKNLINLIKVSLSKNIYWKLSELTLKVAKSYIDIFDNKYTNEIVIITYKYLEDREDKYNNWTVNYPALDILTDISVKKFLNKNDNKDLQNKVFKQILRYGINDEGNAIIASNYIKDLSLKAIRELELKKIFSDTIQKLLNDVDRFSSSRSGNSLNSLLLMNNIVDLRIIKKLILKMINVIDIVIEKQNRIPLSFVDLFSTILILIDIYSKRKKRFSFLYSDLEVILNKLKDLWKLSIKDTSVFSISVFPRNDVPNLTVVFNWLFATLELAKLFNREDEFQKFILDNNKSNFDFYSQSLKVILERNLLNRNINDISKEILIDSKKQFYEILPLLISNIHKVNSSLKEEYFNFIFKKIFMLGPHQFDSLAISTLLQYNSLKVNLTKNDLDKYYNTLMNSKTFDEDTKRLIKPLVNSLYRAKFKS